jgi:deazaflavin-dependent oxidoreductase (nitroreductase family)
MSTTLHPPGAEASPEAVRRILRHGGLIDMSTTGRRTGRPRRIEIVYHVVDGRIFISGMPSRRTRAWIHNLEADPRMTIHLKVGLTADIPARARVVTDPDERRTILPHIARAWGRDDVERMVAQSPLIEVTPDPGTGATRSS